MSPPEGESAEAKADCQMCNGEGCLLVDSLTPLLLSKPALYGKNSPGSISPFLYSTGEGVSTASEAREGKRAVRVLGNVPPRS